VRGASERQAKSGSTGRIGCTIRNLRLRPEFHKTRKNDDEFPGNGTGWQAIKDRLENLSI
jgi:hypothetical protein